jgi:hypothetical protein
VASRYPRYHAEYFEFLRRDPLRAMRRKLLERVRLSGATWPAKGGSARARIDPRSALRGSSQRIAVWGLRTGTREEAHVLALARRMAGTSDAKRLLVFGEASEALRHTGVVDVIPHSDAPDQALPDDVLASLAGCEELMLADPTAAAPEGIPAYAA